MQFPLMVVLVPKAALWAAFFYRESVAALRSKRNGCHAHDRTLPRGIVDIFFLNHFGSPSPGLSMNRIQQTRERFEW
jgi:hypothetical protein